MHAMIPISWIYIILGFFRLLRRYILPQTGIEKYGIQFLASLFVLWDVIQCILAQDFRFTFNLKDENIIFDDKIVLSAPPVTNDQIGRVVECFDQQVSRIYPYQCENDIAVGALKKPRPAADCRVLK
jgi:hypothetical protein